MGGASKLLEAFTKLVETKRLADENKEYRELFFNMKGFGEEELREIGEQGAIRQTLLISDGQDQDVWLLRFRTIQGEEMNSLILVLSYLVLCFSLLVFVRELLRRRWVREMKELARKEVNRNRFGSIRTDIMRLWRKDLSSLDHRMMRTIYKISTVLMRKPHDYADALRLILDLPTKKREENEENETELNQDERRILLDLSSAIDLMARDYSNLYRFSAWMLDKLGSQPKLWLLMIDSLEKRGVRAKEAKNASEKLRELGTGELVPA